MKIFVLHLFPKHSRGFNAKAESEFESGCWALLIRGCSTSIYPFAAKIHFPRNSGITECAHRSQTVSDHFFGAGYRLHMNMESGSLEPLLSPRLKTLQNALTSAFWSWQFLTNWPIYQSICICLSIHVFSIPGFEFLRINGLPPCCFVHAWRPLVLLLTTASLRGVCMGLFAHFMYACAPLSFSSFLLLISRLNWNINIMAFLGIAVSIKRPSGGCHSMQNTEHYTLFMVTIEYAFRFALSHLLILDNNFNTPDSKERFIVPASLCNWDIHTLQQMLW